MKLLSLLPPALLSFESTAITASPSAAVPLTLHMEDVLACERGLWVRGRIAGFSSSSSLLPAWWRRWRGKSSTPTLSPEIRLETRISGHVFEARLHLSADGTFDHVLQTHLPASRRGWRVARHRVWVGEQTAECCSVALHTADEVGEALAVVLPTEFTLARDGAPKLTASELAGRLPGLLRHWRRPGRGRRAIYYLAAVPVVGEFQPVELALAATSCSWPEGTFLWLHCDPASAELAVSRALDRLRWLHASDAEVTILNLEPGWAKALEQHRTQQPDRARVNWLGSADEAGAETVPAELARWPRPVREGLVPRYPVVFCHGLLAFSALRMNLPDEPNYFTPLREFLRDRGVRALYPRVAPTGGVAERARQLLDQIRAGTSEPVNLVAHSMGGLDARYLITHLGMAERVRSLTTVATPHRGTYLADWLHENFRQKLPLFTAFDALGVNLAGFADCRREACQAFNAATPDAPGVRYYSYSAEVSASRVTPYLRRAWNLLTPVEGPNDGMVSVESARWGESLGVLHADHFAQTPDAVHLRAGESFDALGFYARLLEDLARRGF